MKETVSQRASRVLRRHDRGVYRFGCDAYFSLAHRELPAWWSDEHQRRFPDALGVYENVPDSALNALVFFEDRVHVLGLEDDVVAYREIRSIEPVSKYSIPDRLTIYFAEGRRTFIPCSRKDDISTIQTFLFGVLPMDKLERVHWGDRMVAETTGPQTEVSTPRRSPRSQLPASRFDAISSVLGEQFRRATDTKRRAAASLACERAVSVVGLQEREIQMGLDALRTGAPVDADLRERLEQIASDYDDAYLALEEDQGVGPESLAFFAKARAAAAVQFALVDDTEQLHEAVCEALMALASPTDPELLRSLHVALQ